MKRSAEGGFTLIELLLTITLIGIVTLALADGLLVFTKNSDATIRRLGESSDAQITAAYFAQDVGSIGLRSTTSPYPLIQSAYVTGTLPATLACGTDVAPDVVLRLGWDDATTVTTATQIRVAYVIQTVSGERQLHRLMCNGSATIVTDTVMAHNLATTAPVITCSTSCTGVGAAVPQSITMALSIKDSFEVGPVYAVTLTGQRRQTT